MPTIEVIAAVEARRWQRVGVGVDASTDAATTSTDADNASTAATLAVVASTPCSCSIVAGGMSTAFDDASTVVADARQRAVPLHV